MTESALNWIDGEWGASQDAARAASRDPGTGEVLGEFADAGTAEADAAIAAARREFDGEAWPHQPRVRSLPRSRPAARPSSRRRRRPRS